MIEMKVLDHRVHEVVSLPRFRIEEGLVNIQAASSEASHLINRADELIQFGNLIGAITTLGAADTLVRLMGNEAFQLAGEITACADGLAGPDGHAA